MRLVTARPASNRCGFTLEVVEDAQPSEEMLEIPGTKDELRRPMMLLVRVKKEAVGVN